MRTGHLKSRLDKIQAQLIQPLATEIIINRGDKVLMKTPPVKRAEKLFRLTLNLD